MAQLERLPQPTLPSPGSCVLLNGAKEMICKCVCVNEHPPPELKRSAFPSLQLAASVSQQDVWGGPSHFPPSALPSFGSTELRRGTGTNVTPASEPAEGREQAVPLLVSPDCNLIYI